MATDNQKIRLLIGDTGDTPQFTDAQLDVFSDLADSVLNIAVAMALEAWAATLAGEAESEKIGDYSYSKKEAGNKLALARHYRALTDNAPAMDWAEFDFSDEAYSGI